MSYNNKSQSFYLANDGDQSFAVRIFKLRMARIVYLLIEKVLVPLDFYFLDRNSFFHQI